MRKKGYTLIGVLLALILLLAACTSKTDSGGTQQDAAPAGSGGGKQAEKQVSIGLTNAPGGFNPINMTDSTQIYLTTMMLHSLYMLDETLEFLPLLADSIETTDNRVYTIHLNPKAVWSDGEPVTADDFVFTVNFIAHPDSMTVLTTSTALIEGTSDKGKLPEGATAVSGVAKVDDQTIRVTMKTPVDKNLFLEKIAASILLLPEHVLKNADPANFHMSEFAQKPSVVNGPFQLVEYKKDQYIEFAKNPTYFRGEPKLDKLYFKIMPAANIVAQLQSGEIDMNYPGVGNIAVADFEKVKNMSNLTTKSGLPYTYQVLFFNVAKISSADARKAIAHAINRPLLVNNLLKGEGEIIDMPYTSIHPYYDASKNKINYDPDLAKSLLEKSGFDKNQTLRFVVPAGNKTREQAADIIAENLKAVGFKVEIEKYDIATAVQKGLTHDYDLFLLGIPIQLDPDLIPYLHSRSVTTNISGYSNPELDALLDKGVQEVDPAARKVVYSQAQDIIAEELPQFTLFADLRLKAVNKRVLVGEPKENASMLYNVHEWDVK